MMNLSDIKREVCEANLKLVEYGLVLRTWGNVSGVDREKKIIAIKPSGVEYASLRAEDIVVVNFNGEIIEGELSPSSDTQTHLQLYKSFQNIGGISHTHSLYATIFAQAKMEIPCFGTTHADYFFGNIPVTRDLKEQEVNEHYEKSTGDVIIERFRNIDHLAIPGVLVASHAPFTWGGSAMKAVENSFVLEQIAQMASGTIALRNDAGQIDDFVLKKHYSRKHGPDSYYGQNKNSRGED